MIWQSAPKVAHSRNCSIQVEETRISSSYIAAITEVLCCFPRHHLRAGDWPFFTIEVVGKVYNHVGLTWVNLVWLHKLGIFLSSTRNSGVARRTRWPFPRSFVEVSQQQKANPQETISISDTFSGLLPMSEPQSFQNLERLQKQMLSKTRSVSPDCWEGFNHKIQEDSGFQ